MSLILGVRFSFQTHQNLFLKNRGGKGQRVFFFKNEMMMIDFMEKGQLDPFLMY